MQKKAMDKSPVISVIMPVYNAEHTLDYSLSSVLGQAFCNIEMIIVDDGSKDQTPTKLREYKADERVCLLKTDRKGPALARNAGLQRATGQYVFFMDADDWIPPDTLSMMLDAAQKNHAQIAVFGFTRTVGTVKTEYRFPDTFIEGKQRLAECLPELYRSGLLNPAWNKLYHRELLCKKGICFPDIPYGEDRIFVFEALKAADRIVVDHRCCYEYRVQQGGSLVSRYLSEKFQICGLLDDGIRGLAEQCGGINEEDQKIFSYMYLKSVLSCISVLFSSGCDLSIGNKYQKIKEMVKNQKVQSQTRVSGGNGFPFKISCLILRMGFVWPVMLLGWGIAQAERRFSHLFLRAKQ